MHREILQLLRMIDEAFDAKSWHGTNLKGSIRGVTADRAAKRPGRGRHSIREIVLHAAYWKYAVRRRLTGEKRGSFALPGSNWFRRDDPPDGRLWKRECALLLREHRLLRLAISRLGPADLERRPPESKVRVGMMVRGIAAHDLYHAGQIQLIKKIVGPR